MTQTTCSRLAWWCVAGTYLLLLAGCGGAGGREGLEGTVTLDGQPLAEGSIRFHPIDGTEGPTAGGKIENGEFSLLPQGGTFPGKYQVEITSTRKTGQQIPAALGDGMVDEYEQYLPARYNTQSELTAEVTESGANRFEFDLLSQ